MGWADAMELVTRPIGSLMLVGRRGLLLRACICTAGRDEGLICAGAAAVCTVRGCSPGHDCIDA
jgi:hypothetical protein